MLNTQLFLDAIMSPLDYAEFDAVPNTQSVVVEKMSDPWHEAAKIAAAVEKRRSKAAKRLKDMT